MIPTERQQAVTHTLSRQEPQPAGRGAVARCLGPDRTPGTTPAVDRRPGGGCAEPLDIGRRLIEDIATCRRSRPIVCETQGGRKFEILQAPKQGEGPTGARMQMPFRRSCDPKEAN